MQALPKFELRPARQLPLHGHLTRQSLFPPLKPSSASWLAGRNQINKTRFYSASEILVLYEVLDVLAVGCQLGCLGVLSRHIIGELAVKRCNCII